jgi:two-component system response regulator DegU
VVSAWLASAVGVGKVVGVKCERRFRVIVADDDANIRQELVHLLLPDYDLIAVENGRELVELARYSKPELVVVDISMPEMNGFEAVRKMKSDGIESKVIFLTTNGNPLYVQEAFRLGASGYVLKAHGTEQLPKAVRVVLEGGVFISPSIRMDS